MTAATATARTILEIGTVLMIGGLVIFLIVMALLWLTLRRRQAPQAQVRGRLWIVGGGVVFPVMILSALMAYASLATRGLTETPDLRGAMVISVQAKLWWWEVRYRDPATGSEIVLANEIRIPIGRPLRFALTASDVIHSFWVPALAGKVDMVPGRINHLTIEAREPGVYRGQCAEYCGDQHARMALHVVALAPQEFDRWLAAQAQPASVPDEARARRGAALFLAQRCDACHTVRGITGVSLLGPDLTHVGSRLFIGAGTLPTHHDAFSRWISATQRVKPGARMPSFDRLEPDALQALAAFLQQLQ